MIVYITTLRILRYSVVTLCIVLTTGCQSEKNLIPGEGYIEVTGGKVWYRIVGEGDKTPLLLLHGGPGVPSYYLNPLAALGNDRHVIFFDQLGCGRSDHKIDRTLMTIDAFVEQVEQVRKALGINEFYLYGSSWGTMLGTDYYLRYPSCVRALILSSPCLSTEMWLRDADTLLATLPDSIQAVIRENERSGTFDSPEYQKAVQIYYKHFMSRNLLRSADIDSGKKQICKDVYRYMWGPSEFTVTGTLKDYDRTDRLVEIKVPTLFICGEYDEARFPTVHYYHSLVEGSGIVMIENAAHMTMQDNPEMDIQAIKDFLNDLEGQ